MNRRDFVKVGVAGAAGLSLWSADLRATGTANPWGTISLGTYLFFGIVLPDGRAGATAVGLPHAGYGVHRRDAAEFSLLTKAMAASDAAQQCREDVLRSMSPSAGMPAATLKVRSRLLWVRWSADPSRSGMESFQQGLVMSGESAIRKAISRNQLGVLVNGAASPNVKRAAFQNLRQVLSQDAANSGLNLLSIRWGTLEAGGRDVRTAEAGPDDVAGMLDQAETKLPLLYEQAWLKYRGEPNALMGHAHSTASL